jgi:hypothetical protein
MRRAYQRRDDGSVEISASNCPLTPPDDAAEGVAEGRGVTSTAFSPTDTPVLSRWAKVLSMLQALISLLIVAILASRAVGLL